MAFVPIDPVLARWHRLVDGLQASPKAFYARVEERVEQRQIPQLKVSRTHWPEAGALSSAREYLRLERLGYRFDICAAPFGRGFFVSWWLVRPLPTWYAILGWHVASLMIVVVAFVLIQAVTGAGAVIAGTLGSAVLPKGNILGVLTSIVGLLFHVLVSVMGPPIILFLTYHLAVRLGLTSIETIRAILILGPLYIRFFNPTTYYSLDTAQMFQDAAHAAVREALEQVTESKGVRALTEREREPVTYELPGL